MEQYEIRAELARKAVDKAAQSYTNFKRSGTLKSAIKAKIELETIYDVTSGLIPQDTMQLISDANEEINIFINTKRETYEV